MFVRCNFVRYDTIPQFLDPSAPDNSPGNHKHKLVSSAPEKEHDPIFFLPCITPALLKVHYVIAACVKLSIQSDRVRSGFRAPST